MTLLIFIFPKQTFLLLHSSLIAFLLLTLPYVSITVDFHFLYNLDIFGCIANLHLAHNFRGCYFQFHCDFPYSCRTLCFSSVRYLVNSGKLVAKNKAARVSSSIFNTCLFLPSEKGFHYLSKTFWRGLCCFNDIENRTFK